jgi:hypothetical protein
MSWELIAQIAVAGIVGVLLILAIIMIVHVILGLRTSYKHDATTLAKVYEAFAAAGIDIDHTLDAVTQMQNRGIIFQERD